MYLLSGVFGTWQLASRSSYWFMSPFLVDSEVMLHSSYALRSQRTRPWRIPNAPVPPSNPTEEVSLSGVTYRSIISESNLILVHTTHSYMMITKHNHACLPRVLGGDVKPSVLGDLVPISLRLFQDLISHHNVGKYNYRTDTWIQSNIRIIYCSYIEAFIFVHYVEWCY